MNKTSKNMKYELTSETKAYNGVTLYRIKALKSFDDVEMGSLGGWIASENNLSQKGNAWGEVYPICST